MFYIFNRVTGTCVAKCKSKDGARRARDKRDLEYGAAVHYIRAADLPNGDTRILS